MVSRNISLPNFREALVDDRGLVNQGVWLRFFDDLNQNKVTLPETVQSISTVPTGGSANAADNAVAINSIISVLSSIGVVS